MFYYTDRKELTEAIWNNLQHENRKATATLTGFKGMGGVGKTTLATEMIHYPKRSYAFRGWFHAETEELLKADYLNLGEDQHITTQDMSEERKIRAVKIWLENQSSSLLVYDNVPDMDTIQEYLPNQGHIIITSRNQHMPNAINIEGMTEIQAMQLLHTLTSNYFKKDNNAQEKLKFLAKELSYLPLALALAGAYIQINRL